MAAVKELCNQGILLNQGRIEYKGNALETVIEYQKGRTVTIPIFMKEI
jgi:lipopolysaccharide transport system ATP-binding protein